MIQSVNCLDISHHMIQPLVLSTQVTQRHTAMPHWQANCWDLSLNIKPHNWSLYCIHSSPIAQTHKLADEPSHWESTSNTCMLLSSDLIRCTNFCVIPTCQSTSPPLQDTMYNQYLAMTAYNFAQYRSWVCMLRIWYSLMPFHHILRIMITWHMAVTA